MGDTSFVHDDIECRPTLVFYTRSVGRLGNELFLVRMYGVSFRIAFQEKYFDKSSGNFQNGFSVLLVCEV